MAIDAPGVLVDTKFNPPVLGALVERRRLVEVLAGSTQPVKLVRAPAGWGKSTLVAAWSASPNEVRPFAWLALDTADDEPRRFWMYVIEGLRRLDPSVGTGSMRLLSAPGTDMRDHVLSQLLNEVAAMPEPAVLAIDDYHLIAGREIHSQLAFFVEHLPPTLQVSLTSRSEPPLPLPRWRARGELLEIDAVQLRFERGEAGELLNDVLGLELPSAQVARLNQRTEGWAAGLYLAALSLRGADDRRHFVERFAGDDRNVVDYLAAEVLAAQPARIREALVRTSILDRLCESLVEAVAGVEEGSTLLREIEAAGLFLVPLDSKRQWYRYHHLFQQLLRLELANAEPEIVVDLHGRAAAWHLEAGSVPEAIEHTLAAGDRPTAIELIAQHWAPTLLAAAGDSLVDTWLSALGDEAVAGDFRLCFARCFIALSLGDMGVVARWLEIAKDAPVGGPLYEGLSSKAGASPASRRRSFGSRARRAERARRAARCCPKRLSPRPGAGSARRPSASDRGRTANGRTAVAGCGSTPASGDRSDSI